MSEEVKEQKNENKDVKAVDNHKPEVKPGNQPRPEGTQVKPLNNYKTEGPEIRVISNHKSENPEIKPANEAPVASSEFEEVKVIRSEPTAQQNQQKGSSYFDGGLLELIGWRILAGLIIGLTLGVATPWAQCMLYSYQYKHTVYNGKRLKFDGTGGELFVNYFKWTFFTIITLGIYLIFVPIKKTKWIVSNLHYEDEPLVKGESYFDGTTLQLIGVNLLSMFLNSLSLGLLYPFTVCFKLKWINKHTIINKKKLVFSGKAINLFGKYLLWCFLTFITFGIYGFWLGIKMLKWQTKNTHIKTVGEVEQRDNSIFIAIPIGIIAIGLIVGLFLVGILSSRIEKPELPVREIYQELKDTNNNSNNTNQKQERGVVINNAY
ncbi:MAG: DUF898 domain-containing protein [Clostridia bacterium]|nr:DUF898 domain-containing protein [Clostridia bacterium]